MFFYVGNLLKILQHCQSGIWYSTASLIAYLKTEHPFFLIPKSPKREKGMNKGRYGNFHEHRGSRWGDRTTIAETDADAFERVEGRYVERFLEGIPLSLGYVDVAYGEPKEKEITSARQIDRSLTCTSLMDEASFQAAGIAEVNAT